MRGLIPGEVRAHRLFTSRRDHRERPCLYLKTLRTLSALREIIVFSKRGLDFCLEGTANFFGANLRLVTHLRTQRFGFAPPPQNVCLW
jgi:hypothetical protein